ncbi:MAG: RsmE family RNA methyltransferase, partial [SAR324 cluster bacterium]|nr:RsmE family RNA methyltransferase [SAR324 cluster bacterium]
LFPKLEAFPSLEDALEQKPLQGKGWMLSNIENQNKGFLDCGSSDHGKPQTVLVGPEGGWHQDEMRIAEMSGFQRIILGPRIMRSETAAITAISIIQYLQGDIGTRNSNP